ncbi:MAG TPA: hypothetical protein VM536_19520, partial [Chloroflexia bacterium]|nr:hypothetical protein [Chloroflexia bacterium]
YPFGQASVFTLFDDGTYQHFDDKYVPGQPAVCSPTAPKGFVVPQGSFNKVWCEGTGARVRERLGWATDLEKSGDGAWQMFDRGIMYWTGATRQIFALYDTNSYGQAGFQRWQVFDDTFTP